MSFETAKNLDDYNSYKKIKENFSFYHRGIDITRGAAFTLLNFTVFREKVSFRELYMLFLKLFLRIDFNRFKQAFRQNRTIISLLSDRADYFELVHSISSSLDGAEIIRLNPHKKSFFVNFPVLYKICVYFFERGKFKGVKLKEKAALILEMTYYCHQINAFEKVFNKEKLTTGKYIPFNSAVGVEAIITCLLIKHSVETFHIFHGIFGRYKIKIANDVINGDNITARKILALSETMKGDLIRDFNQAEEMVFVAGNPKYPLKPICSNRNFRNCLVLSGFEFYDNDFVILIEFLNEITLTTGIKFTIKPHPNSKILEFPQISSFTNIEYLPGRITVKELLKSRSFDFAITFNSVTYYECLYYGLVTFRYGVNENVDYKGLDDKFFDAQSLLERISVYSRLDPKKLDNDISRLLTESFGMGINNFQDLVSPR
jgi:hypothetical protein